MEQKIKISIFLTLLIIFVSIITANDTHATVRLLDGKLILNGYAKQVGFYRTAMKDRDKKYHDTSLDFFKTSAGFEALYKIKDQGDYSLDFFTGMKWWYEWTFDIDEELRRNIPSGSRKYYTTPENFDDDVLNEAYFDFKKGPWQIRMGKQIVVWGNLDVDRAADVVNAVDFRHSIFGIDKWEEFKRGSWMIRMFYQSELPGTLRFETILNPGDFKRNLIPFTEGYHYGPDAYILEESRDNPGLPNLPPFGWGYAGWLGDKIRKDAPGYSTKNWELGFKISGYTWNWDWSLIYYNRINRDPVADPYTLTPWATQYFGYGVLGDASPLGIPTNSGPDVFKFKRSEIVGGTLEREVLSGGPVFRGGILTFEWFYEIGTPLNKTWPGGEGAKANMGLNNDTGEYGKIVRRDIIGGAVKFYQKIYIPGFTNSRIATGKRLEYTLTYFMEKVMNHDRELVLDSRFHEWNQSIADSISFFVIQQMFNFSWTFVFNSYYKPRLDKWFMAPAIHYTFPGSHWYAELGYIMYGGAKNKKWTNTYFESKESIMFKFGYEF